MATQQFISELQIRSYPVNTLVKVRLQPHKFTTYRLRPGYQDGNTCWYLFVPGMCVTIGGEPEWKTTIHSPVPLEQLPDVKQLIDQYNFPKFTIGIDVTTSVDLTKKWLWFTPDKVMTIEYKNEKYFVHGYNLDDEEAIVTTFVNSLFDDGSVMRIFTPPFLIKIPKKDIICLNV